MNEKELSTLKNFIKSNNSFSNALTKNKYPTIDIYLGTELVVLYFKLLKVIPLNLSSYEIDLIHALVSNAFTIKEDKINILKEDLPLTYFINLINKIEQQNKLKNHNRLIYLNKFSEEISPSKELIGGKIINFRDYINNPSLSMRERSYIFESTTKVTPDTTPYIEETNNNFIELLNELIIKILNSKIYECPFINLQILGAYLTLYPCVEYAKNKCTIPFHLLQLPQNEIGLIKTTYQNDFILELESYLLGLDQKKRKCLTELSSLQGNSYINEEKIKKIRNRLDDIDKEKFNMSFNYYLIKFSSEIYNHNLLDYINKAFLQGNVDINYLFKNPTLKMFYIDDGIVEFYCAMHLSTLMNLLNHQVLLDKLEPAKKLRLEV